MNHYGKYTIQIVCESKENKNTKVIEIETKEIKQINSILDLGLRHQEQIEILKKYKMKCWHCNLHNCQRN